MECKTAVVELTEYILFLPSTSSIRIEGLTLTLDFLFSFFSLFLLCRRVCCQLDTIST